MVEVVVVLEDRNSAGEFGMSMVAVEVGVVGAASWVVLDIGFGLGVGWEERVVGFVGWGLAWFLMTLVLDEGGLIVRRYF